jgi:serine/threonine protein kinase/WD40 repeat protein
MPDCPSDADLAGFLNESLPPESLAGLSAHVDGCPLCQVRLDRLTHDADGAVARYKELSSVITSGPNGARAASPEAGTLILGANQPNHAAPRLHGVPSVPGFDVAGEIGRGGMGVVYKARHRRLNRLCALKMVLAGGAADTVTVQRFLFEAEILARVQHAQVVQVFEVDTYQGPSGVPIPYLAMELLEGGSLAGRIKEGPLDPREAAELMEGVARAVHAAHLQGVIHRDLKPGNILFPDPGARAASGESIPEVKTPVSPVPSSLTPPPSPLAPKVTDFGLAKFIEAGAGMTQSGQVVGTPHYMAPEQAAGARRIGPPADVYALGAILFECLTGRRPFEGDEPMSVLLKVVNEPAPDVRAVRPDVPRDLAAVVARCLAKEPRRRYPSAADLADDLRRFLENRPTVARPLRRRERLWLWAKRNPAVASLTAALAAVLVVAFASVTWFWLEAERTAEDERRAKLASELSELRAKEEARRALEALEEAGRQKKLATHREAEVEFARAVTWCEEGRVEEGLKLFVRVVELAQASGAADLERAARTNIAAWPRELPPARREFRHVAQPRLAAFHPDGRRMVTAGREGEVYLWDLATGDKLRTYKPATSLLTLAGADPLTYWTVAVSPDGETVVTGGTGGRLTLWDVDAPDPRLAVDVVGFGEDVWSVAFAPDGTLWASDDQGVRRWDLAAKPKPAAVARLNPGPRAIANVLVVSPDGKRVYTGDREGWVREWDAEKGTPGRTWRVGNWVQDLAISPDGTRIAATGPDGFAHVIDLGGARPVVEIALGGANGNGIAFAPKRPFVLTSDADGNVRFWHRDTGHPIGIPMRFFGEVTRMRFRPDSDEFAVPAGDNVYVCGVPDPPSDLIYAGRDARIRGLDFSPGGDRIAVAAEDAFEVFDAAGHRVQRVPYSRPGLPRMASPLVARYDPDPARPRVFRGTRGGLDRIDVPDGKAAEDVPLWRSTRVTRIEFLPRGTGMFVMDSSTLTRYDPATLKRIRGTRPAGDGTGVTELSACAVRPDGGELLVTYGERVAFLNPTTLQPARTGWAAGYVIADAAYTPDGRAVLVGRRDNMAELLDAKTGKPLIRPMPHTRGVTSVAVSPDGKVLLTGCRDGTARFWDAGSGYPLGAPLRHLGPVLIARYGPDGEHVATGTANGHVMLWDVPPPPTTKSLDELRAK